MIFQKSVEWLASDVPADARAAFAGLIGDFLAAPVDGFGYNAPTHFPLIVQHIYNPAIQSTVKSVFAEAIGDFIIGLAAVRKDHRFWDRRLHGQHPDDHHDVRD